MLRAEGIHKSYKSGKNNLHVLEGIDIDLKIGEKIAIVGPSGAGKSTLLHILGGIDKPDKGKVYLNNLDFYNLSDTKRARFRNENIGFVFQFYHLLSEFTALENVMLPALVSESRKSVKLKDRAKKLLEEFGLGDRLQHKPGELSGGEQQRVAIGRALINSPSLLLCDEPTGNLDSKMGVGILNILFGLNKKETTILIVTHDAQIAKRAQRVIEMRDGRVQ